MEFTITFDEPVAVRNDGSDHLRYSFPFTIVDSAFIGTPEQTAGTKHRRLWVTVYPRNTPWPRSRLSEPNLIKVLFHYGMHYISEAIQAGTLPTENTIHMPMIDTANSPNCPLTDLNNIPPPTGHTFQVEQERRIGFC